MQLSLIIAFMISKHAGKNLAVITSTLKSVIFSVQFALGLTHKMGRKNEQRSTSVALNWSQVPF